MHTSSCKSPQVITSGNIWVANQNVVSKVQQVRYWIPYSCIMHPYIALLCIQYPRLTLLPFNFFRKTVNLTGTRYTLKARLSVEQLIQLKHPCWPSPMANHHCQVSACTLHAQQYCMDIRTRMNYIAVSCACGRCTWSMFFVKCPCAVHVCTVKLLILSEV